MREKNYGIFAAIDWNSNRRMNLPTSVDLAKSNFDYVRGNGYTNTALNFGHEIYPTDEKGCYYGLVPQLWSKMPNEENSRYVNVVFMKSQDYRDKQNYIVGFYAFPVFEKIERPSPK